MTKRCSKCGEVKPLEAFHKKKTSSDGHNTQCKPCRAELNHAWQQANSERVRENGRRWHAANLERAHAKDRAWQQANPERVREISRKWREENPDASRASSRKWKEANPERQRKYQREYNRERLKTDVQFRLSRALRSRLRSAIRDGYKGGSAVRDLGCSITELKAYLESMFEPDMSWDNWTYTGWHIDHIRPLASFDLTDPVQVREACNYKNLQPLWAADNFSKGDSLPDS